MQNIIYVSDFINGDTVISYEDGLECKNIIYL